MENNLITLQQEPVIIYEKIKSVGEEVQKRISDLNLENQLVTEDTIKAVKGIRTDLNKEFATFEEQRKFIKNAVTKPYQEFEEKYKEFIATHYNNADNTLKNKISDFENKLKEDKAERLKSYFTELCQSLQIDFLTFEQVNINVTLSASEKSLKETITAFVEGVNKDLDLLKSIPESDEFKAEVLHDYKKSLDMANALRITQERKKAKEEELKRIEEQKIDVVKNATTAEPQKEVLQAPMVEETPKLVETQFRVRGTIEQLKALKQFIIENNIEIL
jgi:hypothetical protein rflaF_12821